MSLVPATQSSSTPAVLRGHTPPMELLRSFGPDGCLMVSREQALGYVAELAGGHYENFSVLSRLVPARLRPHFAAVYAFCRWADDLGDETGRDDAAKARSMALLAWWRGELRRCFAGEATHPVFMALAPTVREFDLPIEPFDDLIRAFEMDQQITRYQTFGEVVGYCQCSANPVGRLVLMLGGYRPERDSEKRFAMSDSICTALQLTNLWQDVRRDLLERDRVYVPATDTGVDAATLKDWMVRGGPEGGYQPDVRIAYINMMRGLVEKTWPLFRAGGALPGMLNDDLRKVVWLFSAGGQSVLHAVERSGCTTLWQRPRLGKLGKASLVLRAMLGIGLGRGTSAGAQSVSSGGQL